MNRYQSPIEKIEDALTDLIFNAVREVKSLNDFEMELKVPQELYDRLTDYVDSKATEGSFFSYKGEKFLYIPGPHNTSIKITPK